MAKHFWGYFVIKYQLEIQNFVNVRNKPSKVMTWGKVSDSYEGANMSTAFLNPGLVVVKEVVDVAVGDILSQS